jgi:hypothetical protein
MLGLVVLTDRSHIRWESKAFEGVTKKKKIWFVCVISLYNELFRSVGATFLKVMTLRGEIVGLIPTVPLPTDLHVTASRYLETNASVGNPF